MRTMLKFLKGSGRDCVLAPLFKLFEAILELLVPLIMAAIIDKGIAGKNPALIGQYAL